MEMATLIPETHEDFDDDNYPMILNSENFSEFHWDDETTNLIIDRCLPPLSPSNLQFCSSTLTSLTFWDMTTFENIQTCLKNLPKLAKLAFSNVLIDEYRLENAVLVGGLIELPNLKEISFLSHCKVTLDDYWLLEFIYRSVSCKNLEKFSFFAEQDVGLFHPRQCNNVLENFFRVNCPALPLHFMLQHCKSLRQVLIGGDGVTLIPSNSEGIDMSSVQLSSIYFQLDVPGISALLNCQNRVTDLTCEDFCSADTATTTTTTTRNCDSHEEEHVFQSICRCIARNFQTLTTVDISPILVTEELTPSLLEEFRINCKCFEDCHKLKTLCLRLCMMEKFINFANSSQGQVINLHLLPSSLIEVEVNTATCSDEEIKLLGERIKKFRKLRRLSIACPPSSPFLVGITLWLPALEELQPQNVNFYSGRVTPMDQAEVVTAVESSKGVGAGSKMTMTVNNRGIFFRC